MNGRDWKSRNGGNLVRGFESLPLRCCGLGTSETDVSGDVDSAGLRLGQSLQPVVELDLERVQREGDEVVVPDEHRDLQQPALVVALGEQRPGAV